MINLQFLIGKLNRVSQAAAESAAALCAARRNYKVDIAHLLLALMDFPDSDAMSIVRRYGLDSGRLSGDLRRSLDRLPSGNTETTSLSPQLVRLLASAWTLASLEFGWNTIRSATLILSLLETEGLSDVIASISTEFLKLNAVTLRGEWQLVLSRAEDVTGYAEPGLDKGALDQFTVDLTLAARNGRIDPVIGREKEIRQIMDILTRRRQNNPILTGEAGVGKTAVVEGFALRVAMADVPPALRDVRILSLDLGLLQAGAGVRGEFDERLKSVISEVKRPDRQIILFIDEAHTLIGGGGAAGQSDAANLLKPALARGELRTIAATTWSEYRKYFERDPALARRFQLVKLDEPSVEDGVTILRGLRDMYEHSPGIYIRDD